MPSDSRSQCGHTVSRRVMGQPILHGLKCGAADVVGGWKIGFTQTEVEDLHSLRFQLPRFGRRRYGRRWLKRYADLGDLYHGNPFRIMRGNYLTMPDSSRTELIPFYEDVHCANIVFNPAVRWL